MNSEDRTGHGWWPYVVPYLTFLLLSEVGALMPDAVDPWLLLLKPGAVLGLILWFRAQGAYPEWRGQGGRIGLTGGIQDVLVGLGLTAIWVAPAAVSSIDICRLIMWARSSISWAMRYRAVVASLDR